MAVNYVGTAATGSQDSGASFNFNLTVPAGANYVVVPVATTSGSGLTATFNGSAMTSLESSDNLSGGKSQLFGILATPGTFTIVVSVDSSGPAAAGGLSFSGVDQVSPKRNSAAATGNSDTPSVTVPSAVGDMVVDSLCSTTGGLTYTAGADQTQRIATNNPAFDVRLRSSTEAGAASVVMTWSVTGAFQWAICGVSLRAAAVAGGGSNQFMSLLGVGR